MDPLTGERGNIVPLAYNNTRSARSTKNPQDSIFIKENSFWHQKPEQPGWRSAERSYAQRNSLPAGLSSGVLSIFFLTFLPFITFSPSSYTSSALTLIHVIRAALSTYKTNYYNTSIFISFRTQLTGLIQNSPSIFNFSLF